MFRQHHKVLKRNESIYLSFIYSFFFNSTLHQHSSNHNNHNTIETGPSKTTIRSVSLNANPSTQTALNGNQGVNAAAASGRPSLYKTQSNVEKITAMLVSQNLMGSRPQLQPQQTTPIATNNSSSSVISQNGQAGGTRVTINVNGCVGNNGQNNNGGGSPPINGILKNNGNGVGAMAVSASASAASSPLSEQRNITFGNMYVKESWF